VRGLSAGRDQFRESSILSFDLDAALRWLKPQRSRAPVRPRADDELAWVDGVSAVGAPLLLDTTVYVDTLQGRSPAALDALISLRTCNHSSVCLAELTHAFGRLNPADPRTGASLRMIGASIRDVPAHRLLAPMPRSAVQPGFSPGCCFVWGRTPTGAERKCLNDSLVYLQARKLGLPDFQS
jgi:hypothetical protein